MKEVILKRKRGLNLLTLNANITIDSQSPEGSLVESIMTTDQVTAEEAILRALRKLATPAKRRNIRNDATLTATDIARFDQLCPAFKVLEDVPDETWKRIGKGRLRGEGLTLRA